MKIGQIRINGVRKSLGYAMDSVCVSFKVTKTHSRKALRCSVTAAEACSPDKVIAGWTGSEWDPAGVVLNMELLPRTRYLVRIEVEGDKGDTAQAEGFFETGKRDEPWLADWISAPSGETYHPVFRKTVTVRPGLVRGRLYAAGVGLFEAYMNGEKLGEEFLKPGITNYEKRIQIITFEADDLKEGENELSFLLGKGWYMGTFGLEKTVNTYGDRMAVIAELYLSYADGTTEVVCTDDSFICRASGIVESGIYFGETVDQTQESGEWKHAEVLRDPASDPGTVNLVKEHLTDRLSLPVIVKEILPVKEILTTPAGECVLDFGQNFAGFPEFDVSVPAGMKIVLDFGEILQNGNFYRDNYRGAESRFTFISDGRSQSVHPSFTYFGFRYVRVSGWPGTPSADQFRGCVLYSDLDRIGFLSTGNKKIDRLYENTVWGLKSNFLDMPTDCPQRDERLGWTGDAQVFAPTAGYHMDTRAFYHKFEQDLMDEQAFLAGGIPNYIPNIGHKKDCTSIWGDAGTFLPMTVWKYTGSREELAYAYPMMKDWVDYMDRCDAAQGERQYTFEPPFQFGDWLGLDGPTENSFKGGTDDAFLGAAYYYRSAACTAEAAEILGISADAEHYNELAQRIRERILEEYFTPRGRFALDTQAAYAVAIHFELWRDRSRLISQFCSRLKKDGYKIRCGFVGATMLCTVLAECGRTDLAYEFLFREEYPGWLYCVDLGATTVWERWNSVGPDGKMSAMGMNSLNHYSYGSVMEFLYAWAAGIRPAEPGFRRAVIAPSPDARIPHLSCSYDSAAGKYVCETDIHSDGTLSVHVGIPFGCEATVTLPRSGEEARVLSAGGYDFRYKPEKDYRLAYDGKTPLLRLAGDERAMEILSQLVPPLYDYAKNKDPEFSVEGLESFYGSFQPIEPEKLDEAIRRISDLKIPV